MNEWGLHCRDGLDGMGVAVERLNRVIKNSCQPPIRVRGHEAKQLEP